MEEKREVSHKLVLLGDASVGKSCIVIRFARDQFSELIDPTIGAHFLTKRIELPDDTLLKYEIWDTAGQERYRSLAPMYYKGASAGLVVYDITNPDSFEGAKNWVKELQSHASTNIILAMAGNKTDLPNRSVSTEAAVEFAAKNGLIFREVSAKEDTNISEIFLEIAKKLPKTNEKPETDGMRLNESRQPESQGWCC